MDTAYVYFIQAGDVSTVKIGSTLKSLDSGLMSLHLSNQQELRLLGAIDIRKSFGEDQPTSLELGRVAMRLEHTIQRQFATEHIRGKWFNLTDELREFIRLRSNVM